MENLFNNHELLQLLIISFILVTVTFDSEVYFKEKLDAGHS